MISRRISRHNHNGSFQVATDTVERPKIFGASDTRDESRAQHVHPKEAAPDLPFALLSWDICFVYGESFEFNWSSATSVAIYHVQPVAFSLDHA